MLSGSQMVSSMISGNSHGLSSYLSDDIEFLPIVGSANSHSQFIFNQCSCIALGCFSLVFFSFCPPIKNCASAMSCYSFHLQHETINDGQQNKRWILKMFVYLYKKMCVHAWYMRTESLADRVSCMCVMYIMCIICIMCMICANKPTWELSHQRILSLDYL